MKTSIITTALATVALGAPSPSGSSGSLINLAETLDKLGPLGGVVNQVNDCIPASVGVAGLSPKADGGVKISLDLDPADLRVQDIVECISHAVSGPVSSHATEDTSKRSPGIEVDIGKTL